jgi:hypothetical protein
MSAMAFSLIYAAFLKLQYYGFTTLFRLINRAKCRTQVRCAQRISRRDRVLEAISPADLLFGVSGTPRLVGSLPDKQASGSWNLPGNALMRSCQGFFHPFT